MSANRLAAVDAYIARSPEFARPILMHLRELVHRSVPQAEETIKWSMPFFTCNGIVVANMAAFKAHASFGIWSEVDSPLRKEGVEARGGGMGSLGKLTLLEDLPPDKVLRALLAEAARKIERGERSTNWKRSVAGKRAEPEVPALLAAALRRHKTAGAQFAAMSPSARREYCIWIGEAKREETQQKRLAEALAWIAEGKGRNWKYERR
ncbi:MAG: YdeI/OmpD-associated family protein [Acidobacteriaceae bacterium]|nr:YdeI/OmpD-associated family protein [Acidobacteriaceae bacterium]